MNLDFSRLQDFLYENRNSEIFDNPSKLYEAFIKIERGGTQSTFDYSNQLHLFYECAYRFHQTKNLQTLIKVALPFSISQNISFDDFCLEMSKLKNISCATDILPNDNMRDRIIRGVLKLLSHDPNGGWTFIDFSLIQGEQDINDIPAKKIYLSVDNKDLHYFSLLLLKYCDQLKIKYNFKINADDRYRRADNVVIYTSDEDLPKYIMAIKQIKNEFPQIDFAKAHLLSYPYNEYIGVASKENNSSTISYTEKLCHQICKLRNEEQISFEHFFEEVKLTMLRELNEIIRFFAENKGMGNIENMERQSNKVK